MIVLLTLYLACATEADQNIATSNENAIPVEKEQEQKRPRVIIVGDSLTAGMGLPVDQAYPKLLEQRLDMENLPTEVLNAGQSGDTTAGGLRRVDWLLQQKPDLLIIELGANDGMRGIPLAEVQANLAAMIEKAQKEEVLVKLMEMRIPPNYGEQYSAGFHKIYQTLATKYEIELIPFLLADVAGDASLNQADGIHPTKEGHQKMAESSFATIKKWRENFK